MQKLQNHAHCALKALRVLLLIGSFNNFFGSFLASDWSASTAIARALLFSREERCAFGMSLTEDGSRGGGGLKPPELSLAPTQNENMSSPEIFAQKKNS